MKILDSGSDTLLKKEHSMKYKLNDFDELYPELENIDFHGKPSLDFAEAELKLKKGKTKKGGCEKDDIEICETDRDS
jgi:hypothetical protein